MKKLKKKRKVIPRLPVEVRQAIRRGGPHSTPKGKRGYDRKGVKKIPPLDSEEP